MAPMQTNFVLTLTGPDRIGIVDEVTGLLLAIGGNVETSRMARLGGEFAVIMLVSMREDRFSDLDAELKRLTVRGYKATTTVAQRNDTESRLGWLAYRIEVEGADHEGIIHGVAHYLSEQGISIESVDSDSSPAPTSGVPLFAMTAQVVVPPGLSEQDWRGGLEDIARRMNLDILVSTAKSQ
jgi:glycine cleavage system transcriptional repressor